MPKNLLLRKADKEKKDEFYTQLSDIEKELKYYKDHFKWKTVFCNCDDPYESNFFKYFASNFNFLWLKKLIATWYSTSPIAFTQLPLFEVAGYEGQPNKAYKIEINEVYDANGDWAINLADVEYLLKTWKWKNKLTLLKWDWDFRSEESIKLLKQSDIIVTNPPFSLFREYVAQLMKYKKTFLIIGNVNAITYREIFSLIKNNQIWLWASIHSWDREFWVPKDYPLSASWCRIDKDWNKFIRVKGVRWYTNLDYKERHEDLILCKEYNSNEYPKFDNYEAINVNKTSEIPNDYEWAMWVPITFMDKYNPDQFEILDEIWRYSMLTWPTKETKWKYLSQVNWKPCFARVIIRKK